MIEVTKDNWQELALKDNELTTKWGNWRYIQTLISNFCNGATLNTFISIFGESEGNRLWEHFKLNCDSIFQKFETYLTSEQTDILLVNLYVNRKIRFGV